MKVPIDRQAAYGAVLFTIGSALALTALAALLAFLIGFVLRPDNTAYQTRYDSFVNHCAAAGGHPYSPDRITFCLTGDGRMLEVYP